MEKLLEFFSEYITGTDALIICCVVIAIEFLKVAVFKSADWFKKACPYIVAVFTIGLTVIYGIKTKNPVYEYIVKGILNTGLAVFGYDAIIAKLKETDWGAKAKEFIENLFKKKKSA